MPLCERAAYLCEETGGGLVTRGGAIQALCIRACSVRSVVLWGCARARDVPDIRYTTDVPEAVIAVRAEGVRGLDAEQARAQGK